MVSINSVQQNLDGLGPDEFHKFSDVYIQYRYNADVVPYGIKKGKNKSINGNPDSYFIRNDKITALVYTTKQNTLKDKITKDIDKCIEEYRKQKKLSKLYQVICVYTGRLSDCDLIDIREKFKNRKIVFIDINTIARDVIDKYHSLALEFFGIELDSYQVFTVKEYERILNRDCQYLNYEKECLFRDSDILNLNRIYETKECAVVYGPMGSGKTKTALELGIQKFNESYLCLCVDPLNNDYELLKEITRRTENHKQLFLIIENVNNFNNFSVFLRSIKRLRQISNLKVLITIGSYEKDVITNTILGINLTVGTYFLKPLNENEITKLVKQQYNIVNQKNVDFINRLSRGNLKAAILISNMKEKVNDDLFFVFDCCYKQHNEKLNLTDIQQTVLGILSLFNGRTYSLEILNNIKELFNINYKEWSEVVDFFVKCNILKRTHNNMFLFVDSVYKDYVLYKFVVIDEKISIADIVLNDLSNIRQFSILIINTLINMFYSNKVVDVIKNYIMELEDNNDINNIKNFYYYYGVFVPDATLSYVYNLVDSIEQKEHCNIIDKGIFNNDTNIKDFDDEILKTLLVLKNTNLNKDAFNVSLMYFMKNPSIIQQYVFYIEQLAFNASAIENRFQFENYIIDKICIEGLEKNNVNCKFLLILLSNYLLQTCVTKDYLNYDASAIDLLYYDVPYIEETKSFRKKIWEYLLQFKRDKLLDDCINPIILKTHVNSRNELTHESFIKFDYSTLHDAIHNSFSCSEILCFEYIYSSFSPETERNDQLNSLITVLRFCFKDNMITSQLKQPGNNEINNLLKSISDEDVCILCRAISLFQENISINDYTYTTAIDKIFMYLENSRVEYFFETFMTLTSINGSFVKHSINRLLQLLGLNKILRIVKKSKMKNSNRFIISSFNSLSKSKINKNICTLYKKQLERIIDSQEPVIPNVKELKTYNLVDPTFISFVIQLLLDHGQKNPSLNSEFLGRLENKKELSSIKILIKDEDILRILYLRSVSDFFDYNGVYLEYLLMKFPKIWTDVVRKIIENNLDNPYSYDVYMRIWQKKDYISIASVLLDTSYEIDRFYVDRHFVNSFFLKNKKEPLADENIDKFFRNYILDNIRDCDKLNYVFQLIYYILPKKRLTYMLYFLAYNSDFDCFKQLHLFKLSYSFSGSIIPVYKDKISYMNDLYKNLDDIKYVKHREYLSKRVYKLNDFIEEIDE